MILVKKLKPEQYGRLKQVFNDVFDSDLPLPHNSDIFAAFEDGKVVGFILAEDVKMLGQIYVSPEKRSEGTEITMKLLKEVRERYEGKENVAAVASETRFEKLYRALKMEKISGTIFRRNI
jgi:hypothetical protein